MSHLVSATLTQEAYDLYKEWSATRSASVKISRAMTEWAAQNARLEAISIQRNILRSRWEYLESNLKLLLAEGKSAEDILYKHAMQYDHLFHSEVQ
jgi:hypothetical protein